MPPIAYAVCCACAVGISVWLLCDECDQDVRLAGLHADIKVSMTVAVRMMIAVLESGASIPYALQAVGEGLGQRQGMPWCEVARRLQSGQSWHSAWRPPDDAKLDHRWQAVGNALEEAWLHGASPISALSVVVEQWEGDSAASIERECSRLSVRLLMPLGLCLLPGFVCFAVVPSMMALFGAQ